jgi:hypothetical protein
MADELRRPEVREGHPLFRRVLRRVELHEDLALDVFKCRCGSVKGSDLMLDFDNPTVPAAKRLSSSERSAVGLGTDRYRCDSCWRLWIGLGIIDADRLREATGQRKRGPLDTDKNW